MNNIVENIDNQIDIIEKTPFCIVDDNVLELEKYQKGLSVYSSKIFSANETSHALQWVDKHSSGVLVCDYDMPFDIDGITFLTRIKEMNSNINLLLLTGFVLSAADRNICKMNNIPIITKDYGAKIAIQNIIYYLILKFSNTQYLEPDVVFNLFKKDSTNHSQLLDSINLDDTVDPTTLSSNNSDNERYKISYEYYKSHYELIINENKDLKDKVFGLKTFIRRNSSISYYKNMALIFMFFFSFSFLLNVIYNVTIFNKLMLGLGIVVSFVFYIICKLLLIKIKRIKVWK